MALPIRFTPILTGAASKRFQEKLEVDKNKKVSPEELERITNLARKILNKSKI